MQEILSAFGIDWRLIVIQIFNFAILVAVLSYFLYTPILNLLNDRQKKIEQGVKDAEKARAELDSANVERTKILGAAEHEATHIVERAAGHATVKGEEIIGEAEEKAATVLQNAAQRGEEIKHLARKESEAEIAKLAILAAEKVLRERA